MTEDAEAVSTAQYMLLHSTTASGPFSPLEACLVRFDCYSITGYTLKHLSGVRNASIDDVGGRVEGIEHWHEACDAAGTAETR